MKKVFYLFLGILTVFLILGGLKSPAVSAKEVALNVTKQVVTPAKSPADQYTDISVEMNLGFRQQPLRVIRRKLSCQTT